MSQPKPTKELLDWLLSADAQPWIERAMQATATPSTVANMRKTLSANQVRAVLEQAELRPRAVRKFSRGAEMFVTAKSLQQATDERTARYKAGWMTSQTTGRLADLCCGIGGDLLAMAEHGPVSGVDIDTRNCRFAEANCRVYERKSVRLLTSDVSDFDLSDVSAWHIDPDRRPEGQRTTSAEFSEPSLQTIEQLRTQNPNAAIKLAPAAEVPETWAEEAHLEWIGIDRECRQLVARFGALGERHGARQATVLDSDGKVVSQVVGQPSRLADCAEVGKLICEPHACIIASGLASELAQQLGLRSINPGVAYLTGASAEANEALSVFEVDEVMPLDLKRVKAALRERGWSQLEIKRRGIHDRPELRPERLRERLKVKGNQAGVVLIAPTQERVVAILARRRT